MKFEPHRNQLIVCLDFASGSKLLLLCIVVRERIEIHSAGHRPSLCSPLCSKLKTRSPGVATRKPAASWGNDLQATHFLTQGCRLSPLWKRTPLTIASFTFKDLLQLQRLSNISFIMNTAQLLTFLSIFWMSILVLDFYTISYPINCCEIFVNSAQSPSFFVPLGALQLVEWL